MSFLINQLINHKGVCNTALATPCLVVISTIWSPYLIIRVVEIEGGCSVTNSPNPAGLSVCSPANFNTNKQQFI